MAREDLIYGLHAVSTRLEKHPETVKQMWVDRQRRDQRLKAAMRLADRHGISIQVVDRDTLDKMVAGAKHQGLVAQSGAAPKYTEDDLPALLQNVTGAPLLLVLDGVQDPHNLGACLRTADAAGVQAVIAPKDRAAPLSGVARKVASGAAEHVPYIQVTNLARVLRLLKEEGIWIVGTADEAEHSLYDVDFKGGSAIVMGGEGKGLRRLTREHCDFVVSIPMAGVVDSLNVSVCAGVCLFEAVRQRHALPYGSRSSD